MANPDLIGKQLTIPLLLSDDADLFFKGGVSDVQIEAAKGAATPSGTQGAVEIVSSGPDFAVELAAVKRQIADELGAVRTDLQAANLLKARFGAQVQDLTVRLAQARNAGDKGTAATLEQSLAKATSDLDSVSANVARLEERQQKFQAKLAPSASTETLDAALPSVLVHINGGVVKATELAGDRIKGTTIAPLASADPAPAGKWSTENILRPEADRRVSDREIVWLEALAAKGMTSTAFNWSFFTSGDSREPELAGVLGGIVGSALTLLVTLGICLPVGVAAAIYLEEFASKNRFTELVEVNINNLAAVPSIVFGLFGLGDLPQLLRHAAVVGPGRRPGAGPARPADHHHRVARRAPGGAAIDPRGGARHRRVAPAGGVPSRAAARHAGDHDRNHHRHGPCAGRDRAPAADRHGRLHRRHSARGQ